MQCPVTTLSSIFFLLSFLTNFHISWAVVWQCLSKSNMISCYCFQYSCQCISHKTFLFCKGFIWNITHRLCSNTSSLHILAMWSLRWWDLPEGSKYILWPLTISSPASGPGTPCCLVKLLQHYLPLPRKRLRLKPCPPQHDKLKSL